jgi:site-specific recombinase XerD
LDAEKTALRMIGHEEEVAERIANSLAKSTNVVYDAKWKEWTKWVKENHLNPLKPTIPNIASFLNFLFNKGQSVSSIAGYRCTLSSAFRFSSNLDISNSQELSRLIQNFTRLRPPKSKIMPKWDLALVLWTLLEKPFESVWNEADCPLKFLTWKVTFLLLLASGARRGELHAITDKNVSFAKDGSYMTLRPDPMFLSKTRLKTGRALEPFRIPSLKKLVGSDLKEDKKLCPVRCLQAYRTRTESIRKGRKLLLLSYISRGDDQDKDISVNTVSGWISDLIHFCYSRPGNKAIELTGSNAHDIRAYAASLVQKGCKSLENVLASGQWSNELVFIEHYLRDLTEQQGSLSRLGPIVAGGQVVQL